MIPKRIVCLFVLLFILMLCINCNAEDILTRKKILLIAERTEEVRQFYEMNEGKNVNCIEKSVLKVSNDEFPERKEIWEVVFFVGSNCGVKLIRPIQISILIDLSGEIISIKPDRKYFENSKYCIYDNDCLGFYSENVRGCGNYIFEQFKGAADAGDDCACLENLCLQKE